MLPIPGNVFTVNNNRNSVRSITALKRGKSGYYEYPSNNNNAYNANNNNNNNNEFNINEFYNNNNDTYNEQLKNNNNNNSNEKPNRRVRFRNTVKVKPYKLMNNYKNYILQRYEEDPTSPYIQNIINKMRNQKYKYIRGIKKPAGTKKRSGENINARTTRRGKYSKNIQLPQNVLNKSNKNAMVAHEYAKITHNLNIHNEDIILDIDKILKKINNSAYPININLGLKSHLYSKYRKGLTPNEREAYKKYYMNEMTRLSAYGE